MSVVFNTKTFIEKSRKVHGNKYDYSLVEYINAKTKIKIICPKHGEFRQTPDSHKRGNGCPKCANELISNKMKSSTQDFIEKSKKVHGDKYDYSKVKYTYNHKKVTIICPIHGEFEQVASSHYGGSGCPKCSDISTGEKLTHTTEWFIQKSKWIHGDKYDYSKVNYKGAFEYIKIICPIHGEFEQRPDHHLNGSGCPICGFKKSERIVDNMSHYIQGVYKLKKPEIYCGKAPESVIYRSSYELKAFEMIENDPNVIVWSSEEVVIPYILTGEEGTNKIRRYFMDLYIEYKTPDGIKTFLIEIKPEAKVYPKIPKSKKAKLRVLSEYNMNVSKWKQAKIYAEKKGWYFAIWTEKELKIGKYGTHKKLKRTPGMKGVGSFKKK